MRSSTPSGAKVELRVFLYRLALTLPLLVVAGWLFVKKRKGTLLALCLGLHHLSRCLLFFVELVPYLPSYGGYVRYIVGIAITVLVGRYAILALNPLPGAPETDPRSMPTRTAQSWADVALALAKNVPGCERPGGSEKRPDRLPALRHRSVRRCGHCSARKVPSPVSAMPAARPQSGRPATEV